MKICWCLGRLYNVIGYNFVGKSKFALLHLFAHSLNWLAIYRVINNHNFHSFIVSQCMFWLHITTRFWVTFNSDLWACCQAKLCFAFPTLYCVDGWWRLKIQAGCKDFTKVLPLTPGEVDVSDFKISLCLWKPTALN